MSSPFNCWVNQQEKKREKEERTENRDVQNERMKSIPFASDTTTNEEGEEVDNKFYDD